MTNQKDPIWTAVGLYGGAGFQLALAVIGGLFLGGWCDEKWGTSPIFALIGLSIGFAGGLINLIRLLNWYQNKKKGA